MQQRSVHDSDDGRDVQALHVRRLVSLVAAIATLSACGGRTQLGVVLAEPEDAGSIAETQRDGGAEASCSPAPPTIEAFQRLDAGCDYSVTWRCADEKRLSRIEVHCHETPASMSYTCVWPDFQTSGGGDGEHCSCSAPRVHVVDDEHACGQY